MRDKLKQRLFDLGYGTGSKTPSEAIARIEELEESNKELTLQLLATSGQAADALDKLAKAVQFIQEVRRNGDTRLASMAIAVLAELEGE
jgi:hypothetical protein